MANFAEIAIFSKAHIAFRQLARTPHGRLPAILRCGLIGATIFVSGASSATALSQIAPEDGIFRGREGIISVPLPPLQDRPRTVEPSLRDFDEPEKLPPATGGPAHTPEGSIQDQENPQGRPSADDDISGTLPADTDDAAPLRVQYGDESLPKPVRDLRAKLIEIALTGDVEKLRPYLEGGAEPTALSVIEVDGDPIDFLKDVSGDGDGVETMAILLEILQSGYVRVDPDQDSEIFVWPYFTQVPLGSLDKRRLVELFEIVTAGDYQRMVENGAYDFYRIGISPGGRLEFFLMAD